MPALFLLVAPASNTSLKMLAQPSRFWTVHDAKALFSEEQTAEIQTKFFNRENLMKLLGTDPVLERIA